MSEPHEQITVAVEPTPARHAPNEIEAHLVRDNADGTPGILPGWRGLGHSPAGKVAALTAVCLLLVCVIAALTVTGIALYHGTELTKTKRALAEEATAVANLATNRGVENASRIEELQQQLADTNTRLATKDKTDAERDTCDQLFTETVGASFREYMFGIGDLVELLGQVPESREQRQADIAATIKVMGERRDEARSISETRQTYIAAERPLPCPIAPPPTA